MRSICPMRASEGISMNRLHSSEKDNSLAFLIERGYIPYQTIDISIVYGGCRVQGRMGKGNSDHKLLATFTLALLIAIPLITTAAGADHTPGSLPAAVDQLLAQDMIQLAQTHLEIAGFHPGRTDGVFDGQTGDAVRQYQTANGIPTSGLLDEPTRRVLFPGFQATDEG
jgi:hypothetical protein